MTGTVIPASVVTPVVVAQPRLAQTTPGVNSQSRRGQPQQRGAVPIVPRSDLSPSVYGNPQKKTTPQQPKVAKPMVSPSNRPQRKAAKAAMGLLINEGKTADNKQCSVDP